jgi:hypothetical protein
MTIGLVEVPESATELAYYKRRGLLDYRIDFKNSKCVRVPEGCKLISTKNDLTEEVAANIVDMHNVELVTFKDYQGNPWSYDNATESFNSLLTANGLDPSKNYAILEIKK